MVVFLHATLLLDGYQVPNPLRWVDDALGAYRMPTLMVLSGLLLHRSLAKPPGLYLSGKARALLWPFVLWGSFTGLTVAPALAVDPWWWLHGDRSHTWFLAVLMICYVLALAVRRVPAPVVWALLLGAALLLGPPDSTLLGFAVKTAWFGSFFFAGASIASRLPRLLAAPWWLVTPAVLIAGAGAAVAVKRGEAFKYDAPAAALSLIGIFAALWLLSRIPRVAPVRWVEWIGRNSVVTYLVHWPWMMIVVALVGRPGGWSGWVLLFATAMTVCVAATWLRPRTPWLYVFPAIQAQAATPWGRTRPGHEKINRFESLLTQNG